MGRHTPQQRRKSMSRGVLLFWLLLVLGAVGLPPGTAKASDIMRLAVLELEGASFEAEQRLFFTDGVRQGARQALGEDAGRGPDIRLMTRENMQDIALQNGVDLSCVDTAGQCVTQIGRSIGADLVLSGRLLEIDDVFTATLKLHRTGEDPEVLEIGHTTARDRLALREALIAEAAWLVRGGLGLAAPERQSARSEGRVSGTQRRARLSAEQQAVVTFTTQPAGALVVIDGNAACTTPCSRAVELGPHRLEFHLERYQSHEENRSLDGSAVEVRLTPRFGWLTVETTPTSLPLTIDDEPVGRAPSRPPAGPRKLPRLARRPVLRSTRRRHLH